MTSLTLTLITSTMVEISSISILEVVFKNNLCLCAPVIELIYIVGEHNTLISINCGTYFVFFNFAFKVCNTAWIMPGFMFFLPLFPSGFKIQYSINIKDCFYTF